MNKSIINHLNSNIKIDKTLSMLNAKVQQRAIQHKGCKNTLLKRHLKL